MFWIDLTPETGIWRVGYAPSEDGERSWCRRADVQDHIKPWLSEHVKGSYETKGADHHTHERYRGREAMVIGFEDESEALHFMMRWL